MKSLYKIAIGIYGFAIIIAACLFGNKKAAKWLKGRKGIFVNIEAAFKDLSLKKIAWFHCASLGEFEQGRNVIETFKNQFPGFKIILTFFSPSGYEIRKDYPVADYVFYLPLDTPKNAKRFIEIVHPMIAVFVKYEFWYNYLDELKNKHIPVYLISAKFRKEQYFFTRTGKWFLNNLHIYSQIFVQDKDSESLLKSHGITKVTLAGDTRFDRVINIARQQVNYPGIEKFKEGNKLWICGSTWENDEKFIFPVFEKLLKKGEKLKLLIAPHEINTERIERILKQHNSIVKFSDASTKNLSEFNVLIIDKIGILSFLYRYADFAYIGGGFGKGIHNLTEAAVYGIPVIFGSNHAKFNEAHEILNRGGGFSFSNEAELEEIVMKFLNNEGFRQSCGIIARAYIMEGGGATEKIISFIEKELK